jgi:hypothetical protein
MRAAPGGSVPRPRAPEAGALLSSQDVGLLGLSSTIQVVAGAARQGLL